MEPRDSEAPRGDSGGHADVEQAGGVGSVPSEYPLIAEFWWDKKHAGCTSCGGEYVNVAFHRCGGCTEAPARFCPSCLTDISYLIDREVVERLRAASNDVNDEWVDGGYFKRWSSWQNVMAARARKWRAA